MTDLAERFVAAARSVIESAAQNSIGEFIIGETEICELADAVSAFSPRIQPPIEAAHDDTSSLQQMFADMCSPNYVPPAEQRHQQALADAYRHGAEAMREVAIRAARNVGRPVGCGDGDTYASVSSADAVRAIEAVPLPLPEPAEAREMSLSASDDYFGSLVARARVAAEKASAKFPQPNYVTLKIAEEAGGVVRGCVHFAEGRMEWSEVEGEIVQLIAMLIRLVTEGDQVNGITPPAQFHVEPEMIAFVERDPCNGVHDWTGPEREIEGGSERTCAKCGMGAMHYDLMFADEGGER